jgi:hypothetical protein
MKVTIDSRDCKTRLKIEKEVQHLKYLPRRNVFGVPAAAYDLFLDIECQLTLSVAEFSFIYGRVEITFATAEQASAFGVWLEDADKKARDSFRTMAG